MINVQDDRLLPTQFGRRVSELYIDPLSAVLIRDGLVRGASKITELSLLHLIAHTPDASPRMYPRRSEGETLEVLAQQHSEEFMFEMPNPWGDQVSYDEFLAELKCACVLLDWIDEKTDEQILDMHRVETGDLLRLVEISEWLLHSSYELARLFERRDLLRPLSVLRERIRSGIKEELLPLVQFRGIGRVRARILYNNGLKTAAELKRASVTELMNVPLIGPKLAKTIKEQAGGKISSKEWEKLGRPEEETEEQRLLTEY
jgi:helicase